MAAANNSEAFLYLSFCQWGRRADGSSIKRLVDMLNDTVKHQRRVWPGLSYPFEATWDGSGTNFAIFSAHAEKVELCLFDETGGREADRIDLPECTHEVWHGYLPDVHIGQLYGYRVSGPYEPDKGHRFNHHKLLLDPYAKALRGRLLWDDALYGYTIGDPRADMSFDMRDSAPFMPKCQVIDPAFTWGGKPPPARPGTGPSSMSCMYGGLPCSAPTCTGICEAPSKGCRQGSSWTTSRVWA